MSIAQRNWSASFFRVTSLLVAITLLGSSTAPASDKGNVPASVAAPATKKQEAHDHHEEHDHEDFDLGVPGDNELLETFHTIERLSNRKDPILVPLIATLGTLIFAHRAIHYITEMQHHRRHLLIELAHSRHSLEKRQSIEAEIVKLESKLDSLQKEIQQKHDTFHSQLEDLKNRGKKLKGAQAAQYNQLISKLDTMAKGGKNGGNKERVHFLKTVNTYLNDPVNKTFVDSVHMESLVRAYRANEEEVLRLQTEFYKTYVDLDARHAKIEGTIPNTRVEHEGAQDLNSRIRIVDQYNNTIRTMTRGEAIATQRVQKEACESATAALVHGLEHDASAVKMARYYSSPVFMRGVGWDAGLVLGMGALTGGSYYWYHQTAGTDPFHHELERQRQFQINWETRTDLVTQLSDPKGQKMFSPVFDAVFEMLNSKALSPKLRNEVTDILKKKDLGEPTLEYLARVEDKAAVDAATVMAFSEAARSLGMYGLNRNQLMTILDPKRTDVPATLRDAYMAKFIELLPFWVWHQTKESSVTPRLQRDMLSSLDQKLAVLGEAHKLEPGPGARSAPLPGQQGDERQFR